MSSRRHDSSGSPARPARDGEDDLEPEAPPSDVEIAEAARLREALAAAAGRGPADLPDEVHARLLEAALGPGIDLAAEPAGLPLEDGAPSAERRAAERLRDRLAEGLRRDPDAEPDDPVEGLVEVASALRHAHDPRPLDDVAATRALARASLGRARGRAAAPARRVTAAVVLVAAAAAALVLLPRAGVLGGGDGDATAELVPARSTQELFDPAAPFPREGGESDRIDRIATARRGDLRQNRFARWGIR